MTTPSTDTPREPVRYDEEAVPLPKLRERKQKPFWVRWKQPKPRVRDIESQRKLAAQMGKLFNSESGANRKARLIPILVVATVVGMVALFGYGMLRMFNQPRTTARVQQAAKPTPAAMPDLTKLKAELKAELLAELKTATSLPAATPAQPEKVDPSPKVEQLKVEIKTPPAAQATAKRQALKPAVAQQQPVKLAARKPPVDNTERRKITPRPLTAQNREVVSTKYPASKIEELQRLWATRTRR